MIHDNRGHVIDHKLKIYKPILSKGDDGVYRRNRFLEKYYASNFIVIDTETNGFIHNEPIQIAIVHFKDGKFLKHYNHFFIPKHECTPDARKIHGLCKSKLQSMGAKEFTQHDSFAITN